MSREGIKVHCVRASAVIAVALVLLCAGMATPSWGQGSGDIYETLVRGLEHRQTLVTRISGEAVEETLRSKGWWEARLAVMDRVHQMVEPADAGKQRAIDAMLAKQPEEEAPSADQYDRGSFLVRFALREQAWDYEAQALIWPGGFTNWGIVLDLSRPPTEAFPLFARTSCHDGYRYTTRRSAHMPEGSVMPIELDRPGPLQEPFCTWLSLSLSHTLWPDWLRDDRFRVVSVEEEQLGEWACYHVVRTIDDADSVGEEHLWIAPDADFAVLRTESVSIEKADPKHGDREVRTWEDFSKVDGVAFLPNTYRYDRYRYGRDTDTPWDCSTRVRIREMTCVPDPTANPFAVGVVVASTGDIGPDADIDPRTANPHQYAPWHHALNVFVHEPLPPDDEDFAEANAEYLEELDGTELAEMQARWGL